MRYPIFIISCFLCFYSSFGQDKAKVENLRNALRAQAEDTVKVKILNELAWEYRKTDAPKAWIYAEQAIKLSDSLSFKRGRIDGERRLGDIAYYQKEFNIAEKKYLNVLKAEIEEDYQYGIGRAQNQLGEIYKNKWDIKKALDYSFKALRTFEALDETNLVALVTNNIGAIYKDLEDYDDAGYFLIEGLELRKQLGDQKGIAFSCLNLGSLYIELKNYSNAIEYLENSSAIFEKLGESYELAKVYNNLGVAHFKLNHYNIALRNYNKSLRLKKQLGLEDKDPNIYNNLGTAYFRKNDLERAQEYYLKSISIQKNNTGENMFADSYSNIGDIYYEKNDYKNAIKYYKKALETFRRKTTQLKALRGLFQTYEKLENHVLALDYSNRYIELSDGAEQNYKGSVELNLDQVEELIKKEREISTATNKLENTLIYNLTIGLFLTLLLFFSVFYGNRQKQKVQKIEELLRTQELKSIHAMIAGQEEERKRIARDLHDRLGSMLAMVKVHYKSVEENIKNLKANNKEQYKKANNLLDTACEEVRKIAQNMTSGVLVKFGLVAALNDLKDTLEQTNRIKVDFVTHGLDDRLDNDTEISLYRIVQELISNVLKHAKAGEITIQLVRNKAGLNMIVEDDGTGFDIQHKKAFGMGFKNIGSRVEKLNGELTIDSTKGNGTTVTIDIPLQNN